LDRDVFLINEETRMAENVQNIDGRTITDEDLGEVTRRLKEIAEAPYLSPEEKAKQRAEVLDEYDLGGRNKGDNVVEKNMDFNEVRRGIGSAKRFAQSDYSGAITEICRAIEELLK
jgi:hypothetical protein